MAYPYDPYPGYAPPGGSSATAKGTAAARPAAVTLPNQFYWATDTDEVTFSDGAAWHTVRQVTGGLRVGVNNAGALAIGDTNNYQMQEGGGRASITGGFPFILNTTGGAFATAAALEAAAATAGAAAALPATPQGYVIFQDSGGATRKIPYYAN